MNLSLRRIFSKKSKISWLSISQFWVWIFSLEFSLNKISRGYSRLWRGSRLGRKETCLWREHTVLNVKTEPVAPRFHINAQNQQKRDAWALRQIRIVESQRVNVSSRFLLLEGLHACSGVGEIKRSRQMKKSDRRFVDSQVYWNLKADTFNLLILST